jgi:glycosyltransferase involved in cell wall biosynthesis
MEAAAAGLPVITTENCGLPLEHGKSAFYVPVNNAGALADEIGRVCLDEGLRTRIGRNAMRTVTENYTWMQYGRKVAGYLTEVAG